MPRSHVIKEYKNFVKGIITEASPLTFPENASIDEANFIFNRDGSRQRRLGLDYETDFSLSEDLIETDIRTGSITTHAWTSISGNTSANLTIVQAGNTLHFYDADSDSISAGKFSFTIDLSDFATNSTSNPSDYPIAADSVRGYLLITNPVIDPFYVYYDKEAGVFSTGTVTIEIRDFFGLDDGTEINENPSTLSNEHKYNLLNQGWTNTNIVAYQAATGKYPSNSQIWVSGKNSSGVFSSAELDKVYFGNTPAPGGHNVHEVFNRRYFINNDSINTAKIASLNVTGISFSTPTNSITINVTNHGLVIGDKVTLSGVVVETEYTYDGEVSTSTNYRVTRTINKDYKVISVPASNSITVRYYYNSEDLVLSGGTLLVRRSVTTKGTETLIKEENETSRFSTSSSFQGRAFYAGISNSNFSNYIFFSRTLRDERDLGICYQESDPTSETISDIVDTDGGFIIIPQASKIVKLIPLRKSLLVFAENGVWDIQGGDRGFIATDYSVTKISSVGTESINTIIPVEDVCLYWSIGGIYLVQPDKVTGELNSVNITEDSIQTLYLEIPSIGKLHAKGHYDKANKKITWLYNDESTYDGRSYRNKYNKELVFNTTLGAFIKNEFSQPNADTPYVTDFLTTPELITSVTTETLTDGGIVVTDSGIDVTSQVSFISRGSSTTKYLTLRQNPDGLNSKMTFSNYSDTSFHDWVTHDGVGINYTSYLYTGYETHEDSVRDKQAIYLYMHFLNTNTGFKDDGSGGLIPIKDSSCLIQAQWNWSNSVNSGRWSSQFEAYRPQRLYIPNDVNDVYDFGFKTVESKNRIRGRGQSLSLYFTSTEGKDMNILGWAIPYTGSSRER